MFINQNKLQPIKKIAKIFRNIVFCILLLIFVLQIALLLLIKMDADTVFGHIPFQMMEVVSDSMYPVLKKGDSIVITKYDFEKLKEGDIITFYQNGEIITHEIVQDSDDGYVITKGRANEMPDGAVEEKNYIGKLLFRIPYAGNIMIYASNGKGRALLAALIIVVLLGPDIFSMIYDRIFKKKEDNK